MSSDGDFFEDEFNVNDIEEVDEIVLNACIDNSLSEVILDTQSVRSCNSAEIEARIRWVAELEAMERSESSDSDALDDEALHAIEVADFEARERNPTFDFGVPFSSTDEDEDANVEPAETLSLSTLPSDTLPLCTLPSQPANFLRNRKIEDAR